MKVKMYNDESKNYKKKYFMKIVRRTFFNLQMLNWGRNRQQAHIDCPLFALVKYK